MLLAASGNKQLSRFKFITVIFICFSFCWFFVYFDSFACHCCCWHQQISSFASVRFEPMTMVAADNKQLLKLAYIIIVFSFSCCPFGSALLVTVFLFHCCSVLKKKSSSQQIILCFPCFWPPSWPSGKVSASRVENPRFKSCSHRDFLGSSHTSDLKIGTPVATLPGAWHCRVSAGTGRPGVSILWLGEMESLISNFYLKCGST